MKTRQRARHGRCRDAATAVAAAAILSIAGTAAQTLDSTVGDIVDEQIIEQVEDGLADSLGQAVEEEVESGVVDAVEQQVESGVVEGIEQQVESGVVEGIEQQVESGVVDGIEQQVENAVEGVQGGLETLDRGVGEAIQSGPGEAGEGGGEGEGGEGGEGSEGSDGGSAGADRDAADRAELFASALDERGSTIERDVWIILVPPEHAARIDEWGFAIEERQTLAAIDRVLVRVRAPEDRAIAEAALELALDAPGTLVDFNHVYGSDAEKASDTAHAAAAVAVAAPSSAVGPALAIGLVDSAVTASHEALRSADIVQKDFVRYGGLRPTRHGTAVASILVAESSSLEARLGGAKLYAASVFLEVTDGEAIATTESLVEALEWLTSMRVPVINMSLSGPPNRVLEATIAAIAGRDTVIVAAVGNNGPAGEPLYPAAYASVVGVTAVDAKHRVYRYANRGRQVTFAAPGVAVAVADSGGGYGTETGTSMAAPFAAAIIARSLAHAARPPAEVLSKLKETALDLGDEDFDDVYGYGLIGAGE